MTNRYVRSGGNTGSWTGTVATLTAGLAAAVAGDDIYIATDHVEPVAGATITYTALGTLAAPNRIFVAPTSSSFPPVAADLVHTPTVLISSNVTAGNIATAGVVSHCEGIIWSSGTAALQANVHFGGFWQLKNCSVIINNTSGASSFRATAANSSKTVLDNVTVQFGAVGQSILPQGGEFLWKNTPNAISVAGSIPTSLFGASAAGVATLRGVDLSAMTPSKNLCAASTSDFLVYLIGCKEPAAWTIAAAQTSDWVTVIREYSENTGLNYTKGKDDGVGTQVSDATLTRTGGASDGTTTTSWRIDTSTKAKAKPERPFKSTPMIIWNDVINTNRVVTVYGIWSGGGVPFVDEIWLEIDYLGSSASPLITTVNTTKATPLTTPGSVATDSSTWSGAGTKFKLVATLSSPQPAMKGPFTIRVCVGVQSIFNIDWQPVLT